MESYKKLNLIKCHYYQIISKITLCSLLFIIFLLVIEKILIVTSLDYNQTSDIRSLTFLFSVFETEKIFSIILFVFIFGASFNSTQDSYRSFILTNKISRYEYFITKYITIIFVLFCYTLILLLSTILISYLFNIIITINYIYSYLSLLLLICYYGLLSILLIQLFNNYYLVIIPFIIYILINSLDNNNLFTYVSIIINTNGIIYNGYLYAISLILFLFLVNLIIYNSKDLQSI